MSRHASLTAGLCVLALAGCNEPTLPAPSARPVRAMVVEQTTNGGSMSLTGQIRAQKEVNLAFRLDGLLVERSVNVGDHVAAGQLIGRLDPQIQGNDLRQSNANLAAAQSTATEARNNFWRQKELLARGFASAARFDQAQQALQAAEAQVEAAKAQLRTARERVGYTELRATAAGAITSVGAWPGEVVRTGQTIVAMALDGERDAVFDVSAQTIRTGPRDPVVAVALTDDASISAIGRVREVAPQADPSTRTFQVKVGLANIPDAMRLGATVTGRIDLPAAPGIRIPATALTSTNGAAAVWVLEPASSTVALRNVSVAQYDKDAVAVSSGLEPGEIVVTAGTQLLRPGQAVRLLGADR